jgi:hypothetical protein
MIKDGTASDAIDVLKREMPTDHSNPEVQRKIEKKFPKRE